jgi:hypothetical protein
MKVFKIISNTNLKYDKRFFNFIKYNYMICNNFEKRYYMGSLEFLTINNKKSQDIFQDEIYQKLMFESDLKDYNLVNREDIEDFSNKIIDNPENFSILPQTDFNKEEEISINLKGRNSRVPKRVIY